MARTLVAQSSFLRYVVGQGDYRGPVKLQRPVFPASRLNYQRCRVPDVVAQLRGELVQRVSHQTPRQPPGVAGYKYKQAITIARLLPHGDGGNRSLLGA